MYVPNIKARFHDLPNFTRGRKNVPEETRGKQCFINRSSKIHQDAAELFGRDIKTTAIKIFYEPLTGPIEDYYWGSDWRDLGLDRNREIGRISKLGEATVVQNYLSWMNGNAARVFGLFTIQVGRDQYPAQLVEFIDGGRSEDPKAWVQEIKEHMPFGTLAGHEDLLSYSDVVAGKLIDAQGFRLGPETKEQVIEYIREQGKYGSGHYQSVPELDIKPHPRNTPQRVIDLKLDEIDFKGKVVYDIGCNSGVFCNYAAEHGAKRVVGLDTPKNANAAQALAIWLGNHNNDYIGCDIKSDRPHDVLEFFDSDITFMLSMNIHVGISPIVETIFNHTKTLIFEENAWKSEFKPEYWQKELQRWFGSVKMIGKGSDHGNKPIFLCEKS